jgi:hypothetical protein
MRFRILSGAFHVHCTWKDLKMMNDYNGGGETMKADVASDVTPTTSDNVGKSRAALFTAPGSQELPAAAVSPSAILFSIRSKDPGPAMALVDRPVREPTVRKDGTNPETLRKLELHGCAAPARLPDETSSTTDHGIAAENLPTERREPAPFNFKACADDLGQAFISAKLPVTEKSFDDEDVDRNALRRIKVFIKSERLRMRDTFRSVTLESNCRVSNVSPDEFVSFEIGAQLAQKLFCARGKDKPLIPGDVLMSFDKAKRSLTLIQNKLSIAISVTPCPFEPPLACPDATTAKIFAPAARDHLLDGLLAARTFKDAKTSNPRLTVVTAAGGTISGGHDHGITIYESGDVFPDTVNFVARDAAQTASLLRRLNGGAAWSREGEILRVSDDRLTGAIALASVSFPVVPDRSAKDLQIWRVARLDFQNCLYALSVAFATPSLGVHVRFSAATEGSAADIMLDAWGPGFSGKAIGTCAAVRLGDAPLNDAGPSGSIKLGYLMAAIAMSDSNFVELIFRNGVLQIVATLRDAKLTHYLGLSLSEGEKGKRNKPL